MAIRTDPESHLQLLFTVMGIQCHCQDTDLLCNLMCISHGIFGLLPKAVESVCSNIYIRLKTERDSLNDWKHIINRTGSVSVVWLDSGL